MSQTIRWGLIGCGDIAQKRVAEAIQIAPNSTLYGVCRRNADELATFCQEFKVPCAYTDADELIADSRIDAVYVATPVSLHCSQTIAAAAAKKHVIVEKPMALNLDECDAMIHACQEYDVKLSVAYYRRFYPIVTRMHDLIAQGAIGRPMSIAATTGNASRFSKDDWRVVLDQGGGGPLMDIGSHRLDLFVDYFGSGASVQAATSRIAADYEAEDCATVLLKFPTGEHGSLQCFFGSAYVPDELTIVGTDGRLSTKSLNGGQLNIERANEILIESHPPHKNLHAPLVADFAEAIASNCAPKVTGEDGREVNRIIGAAYANRS